MKTGAASHASQTSAAAAATHFATLGSSSEFSKLFPRPEHFSVCSTLCVLVRDGMLEPVQAATTHRRKPNPPESTFPAPPARLAPCFSQLQPAHFPWQRLVAFYVLYDLYKSEAAPSSAKSMELGSSNPFLPVFLDTLRNKAYSDECERGFLISLLCTPPRDLPKVHAHHAATHRLTLP